jgi:hypothetical protein
VEDESSMAIPLKEEDNSPRLALGEENFKGVSQANLLANPDPGYWVPHISRTSDWWLEDIE